MNNKVKGLLYLGSWFVMVYISGFIIGVKDLLIIIVTGTLVGTIVVILYLWAMIYLFASSIMLMSNQKMEDNKNGKDN